LVQFLHERRIPAEQVGGAQEFLHLCRHRLSPLNAGYARIAIATTSRCVAPTKSCRGRPIFCSGSAIISFHCATQPTVRATANNTVNMESGKPIARKVMPE